MTPDEKDSWTLAELAGETGLSPRTIRYYIARGLLEGPAVAGRGAVYGSDHLARLKTIRELQSRGCMLAEIGRAIGGGEPETALPEPEPWVHYELDSDVVVRVRSDTAPWRSRQIRKALTEFARKVKREDHHAEDDRKR